MDIIENYLQQIQTLKRQMLQNNRFDDLDHVSGIETGLEIALEFLRGRTELEPRWWVSWYGHENDTIAPFLVWITGETMDGELIYVADICAPNFDVLWGLIGQYYVVLRPRFCHQIPRNHVRGERFK